MNLKYWLAVFGIGLVLAVLLILGSFAAIAQYR